MKRPTLRDAFKAGERAVWARCAKQLDPNKQTHPANFEEWEAARG